ncbi:MAG TPA: hypothetical protein VE262_24880 [Blastocatellia bacterium]|nr:hypothetical protein [Blastocatellia bacterium]
MPCSPVYSRTPTNCPVVGSWGKPSSWKYRGPVRITNTARAARAGPPQPFTITRNDSRAMASIWRARVAGPNVRRTRGTATGALRAGAASRAPGAGSPFAPARLRPPRRSSTATWANRKRR